MKNYTIIAGLNDKDTRTQIIDTDAAEAIIAEIILKYADGATLTRCKGIYNTAKRAKIHGYLLLGENPERIQTYRRSTERTRLHAEVQNEHGYTLNYAKCSYINRTWERYEYESVIHKVLDGLHLTHDKTENLKRIKALKRQIDHKALSKWAW